MPSQNDLDKEFNERTKAKFEEITKLADPAARIAGYSELQKEISERLEPRAGGIDYVDTFAMGNLGFGGLVGVWLGWMPAGLMAISATSAAVFAGVWAAAVGGLAAVGLGIGLVQEHFITNPVITANYGTPKNFRGAYKLAAKVKKNLQHDAALVQSQKAGFKAQQDGAQTFDTGTKLRIKANTTFKKDVASTETTPASKPVIRHPKLGKRA